MEAVALKLPDTLPDDTLLRLRATWEEYCDVAEYAPYTIQFLNDELIMSQASAIHEALVIRIGALLMLYFDQLPNYQVFASNVTIVIPDRQGNFNADVSVVKEPVEYGLTPSGNVSTMRITNPEIVVEVLSKATQDFDRGEKLAYYKLIPSLQHILFVDQTQPLASVYSRTDQPDEWLNHDYRSLDAVVQLGDLPLKMADIYRKTTFTT